MYPPFYGGADIYGIHGSLYPWGYYRLPYGALNLTESSPAQQFKEPVAIDEAYGYLKIPSGSDDGELLALISAARLQAEIQQGKDLLVKQWDLTLDYWPAYRIELRTPLRSVDLVQYTDSGGNVLTLTEGVDYMVDKSRRPGCIMPTYNKSWPTFTPWPSSSILIRHTSGYQSDHPWWSDTGALVKVGIRKLVSLYYFQRIPFSVAIQQDQVLMNCLASDALERVK